MASPHFAAAQEVSPAPAYPVSPAPAYPVSPAPAYPVSPAPLAFADAPAPPTKPSRQVRFDERRFSIVSILGFATTVGLAGAGAQYTLAEAVTLGAGVGTNAVGPQFTGYVNLRPLHWSANKVAIGVGPQIAYAAGPYTEMLDYWPDGEGGSRSRMPHDAQWIQVDLGVDVQSANGFVFRFSQGVARMLNPRDYEDEQLIPTTTVTLGYAFDAG
jgi:hypothetical protein